MRWFTFGVVLAAGALRTPLAAACPCSDDASGGFGLTLPDERLGVAVVATSRRALGYFDSQGVYRAQSADASETSEELLLRAGARVSPELEGQIELGGASYRFHSGRFVERAAGLGDALVRGRYLLRTESMPHERVPLPAVGLSALVRAPVGVIADQRSTGFGSGGAQLGLGAWEVGAGLDASRALWPELSFTASLEAALRFSDRVLGRERRLGPRAELTLGLRAFPQAWLSGTLALRTRLTGDVTFDGHSLPGTGERLLTAVLGASHLSRASGVRTGLTLSIDAPWRGVGRSSTAAVALGCSLGYAF